MEINLEQLGITKEDLIDRVVDQICEALLWDTEEDGYADSEFARRVKKHIDQKVNVAVSAVADKYMLPAFTEYLETMRFEETNAYGERKSEGKTFREFLAHRAETYLTDEVDDDGRTQKEARDRSYWKKVGTRAAWLVNRYFKGSVESKLKAYVDAANEHMTEGLTKALEAEIAGLMKKLDVKITRR